MPSSLMHFGRSVARSITLGRSSAAEASRHKGLILLYHRVASPDCDPQQLCVSPDNFTAQLRVLKQIACPLPLAELVTQAASQNGNGNGHSIGSNTSPAVAVTFDDGYADNFHAAQPILAEHGIPALVFIAAGYVDAGREFWWDELEQLLLQPGVLPQELSLAALDGARSYHLDGAARYDEADLVRHRAWSISQPTDPTPRHALYRVLCDRLRRMTVASREQSLDELFRWAGRGRIARDSHRAMSSEELRSLSRCDSIEIGAHTMHHPVLAGLSPDAQESEVVRSRHRLFEITGTPPTSFSYPYGTRRDFRGRTVQIVRSAGFSRACANSAGLVDDRTDAFRLPRHVVRDWPADVFARKVEEWLRG